MVSNRPRTRATFVITNRSASAETYLFRGRTTQPREGEANGERSTPPRQLERVFKLNGREITRSLLNNNAATPNLGPGESARVVFRVKTRRRPGRERKIRTTLTVVNASNATVSTKKKGSVVIRGKR